MRNRRKNCLPSNAHGPLTVREMKILRMVALGYSNSTIAEKLSISPHTVKTYLYTIYRKIRVPSRVQAILWVAKNRYATARNIEIVPFYREKPSARNNLRPSALSELLLDLEANDHGIRTLLVERLDQLAQD